MQKNDLTVIGRGVWGSALAQVFRASQIIAGKAESCEISTKYCVLAVEAQSLRQVILRHKFAPNVALIVATKGIEQTSLKLMGQVIEEVLPNEYVILSGPNFADEISANFPAATTISCKNNQLLQDVVKDLATPNFRLYACEDVVSAQVGGAVKNVIAIASGICVGKNLGENARSALITRGLAEISKLSAALGGNPQNLLGLCGVGDLMLTCFNLKSRNTKLGFDLAQGADVKQLIAQRNGAIEGYYTAKSVYDIAQKLNLELPICKNVFEILYCEKDINKVIYELINRPQG